MKKSKNPSTGVHLPKLKRHYKKAKIKTGKYLRSLRRKGGSL